jgi:hypothetical protein
MRSSRIIISWRICAFFFLSVYIPDFCFSLSPFFISILLSFRSLFSSPSSSARTYTLVYRVCARREQQATRLARGGVRFE